MPSEVAWREVAPGDGRGSTVNPVLVGLTVGLAIALFLYWRGRHVAAMVLLIAVVVTSLARWFVPGFDRAVGRLLHRVGHAVGVVLTWVLLVPVMVVVLTPAWLYLRATRWNPMEPVASQRGRWNQRAARAGRSFTSRLFTAERSVRRPWPSVAHGFAVGGGVCLLFGLVALGAYFAVMAQRPSLTADGQIASWDAWRVFGAPPWGEDVQHDVGRVKPVYDPILTWRIQDHYRSRYANVDGGARRSYSPAVRDGQEPLDVWFFGGSALFGYNQREDFTIVSDVAKMAEHDGVPIVARNFGVLAYTNWQEALLMAELLTERSRPDLIVFYDGMNDFSVYQRPGASTRPSHNFASEVGALLENQGANLEFPVESDDASDADGSPRGSPANAVHIYNQGVELSHRLGQAFGVDVATYYQPSIYTRRLPVDPRVLRVINDTQENVAYEHERWDRARAGLDPRVIDLGGSLDGVDGTLFYDSVHHGERAAQFIAEAMYTTLGPQLEQLAAETPDDP